MQRIPTHPHYCVTREGRIWSDNRGGAWLHPHQNKLGYTTVPLFELGARSYHLVHRLVAQAFIPNPDNLPFACHKDDDPSNNCVENLFWGTQLDNMQDKVRKGRQSAGADHGRSVLTNDQVNYIRAYPRYWGSQTELARQFGVRQSIISGIVLGKTWTHITS